MNTKRVLTGVETERDGTRTPNYTEKYLCDHCKNWVDEAEEYGDKFICPVCIGDFVKCSRCGQLEVFSDAENGLCYECQTDDFLKEALAYFGGLHQENMRQFEITKRFIHDKQHKYAGVVSRLIREEQARRQKENK